MSEGFLNRYGPWALVTGAAEGLGAEFASQIAAKGLGVLLVDVQLEKATKHAADLAQRFGVETRAIECDLSKSDFLDGLREKTDSFEIGLLICSAGIGTTGPFLDTPIDAMKRAVQVNAVATLDLCYALAPPMVERGKGGIMLLASNSAYAGTPYVATYAATKAFDLSLGEALWYELAPHGVDAMAFSPMGTNTPGLRRGMPAIKEGDVIEGIMTPEDAVGMALGALGKTSSLRADFPDAGNAAREAAINRAGDALKSQARYTGSS